MDKIKLIHLFSGIGAPEMALKRLGVPLEIVGYSEIDKYAIQSYRAIHGENIPNLGDIKQIEKLPKCNLLFYGSPCTSFSVAGKQEGLYDKEGNQTKSGLLLEVERLIHIAKNNNELPEILIMENVKNLVGKKFKPDFDRWLNELDSIGYNNYYQVLNAKDYGVPQNCERVFVVSIRKDIDKRGYTFPGKILLTKKLKDILENEVDEKFYISQDKVQSLIKTLENKEVSNTVRIGGRGSLDRHTWDLVVENRVIQVGNIVNTGNWSNPQRGRIYSSEGCSPTLNTCGGGGLEPKIIIDDTQGFDGVRKYEEYSPTLRASRHGLKTVENLRIRKLTPLECWRLMGISDNDFIKAQVSGISNTQLYKQAGNSIVVNVLYYIFKNLFEIYDTNILTNNT